MKQIAVIGEENKARYIEGRWRERRAARAVVTDDKGREALLFVSKDGYYKLPGGGIDEGEDILTALHREIKEELGCTIADVSELGFTDEYAPTKDVHQQSYCFTAMIDGVIGEPDFTEEEIADGFRVIWADSLSNALELVQNAQTNHIGGKFIQERDGVVLESLLIHATSTQ